MTASAAGIAVLKKLLKDSERRQPPGVKDEIPFGRIPTDHMLVCDYSPKEGWRTPEIVPYGPFTFSPDAVVFHYGQQVFEGLKAYRCPHNPSDIFLFRPEENARRFFQSAEIMGMVPVPIELFLHAVRELVATDRNWILPHPGSLYIRPMLIPLDTGVSYRAAESYRFAVILSPAKAYFSKATGVNVYVERTRVRAVRGGVGEAKAGGNYGGSVAVLNKAKQLGADHVLWLDGVERRFVEEVGAMNVMFVYDDGSIATPQLSGSILHGVTRQSLVELMDHHNKPIRQVPLPIDQVLSDVKAGRIKEVFGCGTAAVVSPVRALLDQGEEYIVGQGTPGPVTLQLKAELESVQNGSGPDPLGWRTKIS